MSALIRAAVAAAFIATAFTAIAQCPPPDLDGLADNQRDDLDYMYVLTGGKFPTGNVPNGDNASGGTFRYLVDDPAWGYPTGAWRRDDWFPQNAGLALTLKNGAAIVYDNNGIEDGTDGGFYDSSASAVPGPGLYRGYCMSNNWDFTYATFVRLAAPTTFDTIIGYYDKDGYYGSFDAASPELVFRTNFWTASLVGTTSGGGPIYDPACATYRGDVLSVESIEADWSISDTGLSRQFPVAMGRAPDPIGRMTFKLTSPVTLPAGEYFYNLEALIRLTAGIDVRPHNLLNQVNTTAKQLVPVAILSTTALDAPAQVDVDSVLFLGASPIATATSIEDVNADGLLDLVLHFRARSFDAPTQEECENPALKHVLTGSTLDGVPFAGADRVTFTGPDCGR